MERYKLIAFWLLLFELHTIVQARTLQLTDKGPGEALVGTSSEQLEHHRRKRASIFIARAAMKGIKAAKKIISGSKQMTTNNNYREFEKSGSLVQAFKDFDKLKASDTIDFLMPNGGYGKAGIVGDRQFILRVSGADDKPVIDVIKIEDAWKKVRQRGVKGTITDRIYYRN